MHNMVDSAAPLLEIAQVGFHYRRHSAILSNISLTIEEGEFVGILGKNGAGKSSLLRILAGITPPSSGEARLAGTPMAEYSPRAIARWLAYVPQQRLDSFGYSVRQMVAMGRVPHRGVLARLNSDDDACVDEAMERMGIAALAERSVVALSGGERQRVTIARALAQRARAILLDEPMAGLDPGSQASLLLLLAELAKEGHTIVMNSHAPEELFAYASRVIMLDSGTLAADGEPAQVINVERMSQLYGLPLRQVDQHGRRFFYPANAQ
ncbi:Iron(3+)-hydroxamate import ATP-binding protein FhuC [Carnimonas sp. R-84981]|uniref:ABC transporter ATP-binding protein n=1 Tax=Carnimonas bestiolae TaxID=3402172 RepID=UPI003EDC6ADF